MGGGGVPVPDHRRHLFRQVPLHERARLRRALPAHTAGLGGVRQHPLLCPLSWQSTIFTTAFVCSPSTACPRTPTILTEKSRTSSLTSDVLIISIGTCFSTVSPGSQAGNVIVFN